jgi:SnoaL-like domain
VAASSDADTIRRGYDAFGRGDMETLRNEVFADDIQWHQGGRNQTSGEYEGIDPVLGLFQKFFQLTDGTFRPKVVEHISEVAQPLPCFGFEHTPSLARFAENRKTLRLAWPSLCPKSS